MQAETIARRIGIFSLKKLEPRLTSPSRFSETHASVCSGGLSVTAGISLIQQKTGAHRAPLQLHLREFFSGVDQFDSRIRVITSWLANVWRCISDSALRAPS